MHNVAADADQPGSSRRVPRQLPRLGRFTGRAAELVALDRFTGHIRLISGQHGVGKSALALKWSSAASAEFPGGQLHVDLDAHRDRDWSTAVLDVLREFVQALGASPKDVPSTRDGLEKCFRTFTSDAPVLVVVDSATTAKEVRSLVPGGAGVVLVTSNDKLSALHADGAESALVVRPLSDDESLALFTELVDEDLTAQRDLALSLVRKCAGLPLALTLVAARLNDEDDLTLAGLVEELGDGLEAFTVGDERPLVELFDRAYAGLPHAEARLYRLIGKAGLYDISVELASAWLRGDARAPLRALVRSGLLTQTGDRFRFHGLIAAHARGVAEAAEDLSVTETTLRWFLVRAAQADFLITGKDRLLIGDQAKLRAEGPFGSKEEAVAWIAAERPNLLPLLRSAPNSALVWQIAESLSAYYFNYRFAQEWIEVTRLGIAAARECENPDAQARLLAILSRPLLDQDELDLAKDALEEALGLVTITEVKASLHEYYGRYFDKNGEPLRAVEQYRLAQQLTNDSRAYAIATMFLGISLADAGQPEAVATLRDAVRLLENDGRMRARALTALGRLVPRDEAEPVLREAVAELEKGDWKSPEADARAALANVLDEPEASEQRRLALDVYERFGPERKAAELQALLHVSE